MKISYRLYKIKIKLISIVLGSFPEQFDTVIKLRKFSNIFFWFGISLLIIGVIFVNGKIVNSGGLLLDVVGVIRIFIDDKFKEILDSFNDDEKYPFGPPSYVTREIFEDAGDSIDIESNINEKNEDEHSKLYAAIFWHKNRGFMYLVMGFLGQLVATWL